MEPKEDKKPLSLSSAKPALGSGPLSEPVLKALQTLLDTPVINPTLTSPLGRALNIALSPPSSPPEVRRALTLSKLPPPESTIPAVFLPPSQIPLPPPPNYHPSPAQRRKEKAKTKRPQIFIVHGHSKLDMVARWIMTLGLDPVIMNEEAGKSQTLIEKLIKESANCVYAIVLMTADDFGCAKNDLDGGKGLKPRARQNVIMELGYFIGKLNRDHVCVLIDDNVEKMSDFLGVEYISIDIAGAWRTEVAQELYAAGIPIDATRLLDRRGK